jgi:alpha-L-arabinofuranosidase
MSAAAAAQNLTANVTVNVNAGRHPIDPRIYGIAYGTTAQLTDLHVPLNRYGGNNTSRYNWQRAVLPASAATHLSQQLRPPALAR